MTDPLPRQGSRASHDSYWICPHGNSFCGQPGWSKCGPCHDDIAPAVRASIRRANAEYAASLAPQEES